MPLFEFPVVMTYRLADESEGVTHSLGVQAVATTPPAALAVAQVLAQSLATLRHPGHRPLLLPERAKVGRQGEQVLGVYAYLFTHGSQIGHFTLPPRIDQNAGELLEQTFAGLDPQHCLGVLMDCVHLTYINSRGLAAFAANSKRLNLHIFRVPKVILDVFELTGLKQLLSIHGDLLSALKTLEGSAAQMVGRR